MSISWVPATGDTGQKTVTATATLIYSTPSRHAGILVKNISATACFVGFSDSVTTGTGFRLKEDEWVFVPTYKAVYGITASGSATVCFIWV